MSTAPDTLDGPVPPREQWPQLPAQTEAGKVLTDVILTTFRLNARLMDVDTADNLWKRPPTSFTAAFLGGANLIPCTVGRVIGTSALVTFAHKTVNTEAPQPSVGRVDWAPGSKALLCVRPAPAVDGPGRS